ncbi:MAG: hypothetical protein B7C55_03655 [Actinomycetales bacterium mxb001]|nr:MAG: hypothetical protein B7C55_03655 [Actinomycetales bacterium mxb001]
MLPADDVPARGTSTLSAPASSALVLVRRRLVPFLFVLYVVAYLDRVNISFAAAATSRPMRRDDP